MHKRKTSRLAGATVAMAASAMVLAACGGSGGGSGSKGASGSLASTVNLSGVTMSVGSKENPEELILGQILVQTLRAAGAKVDDKTGLTGTSVVRAALVSGQVNAYYEYTGTGWLTVFNKTNAIADPVKLFDAVKALDAKNGISWFARAPFNDTYAVGVGPAAKKFGVTTLSQYAAFTRTNPSQATLCASSEFKTRDDGLPGLEKKYNFTQPKGTVFQVEDPVVYQALQQNKCNFLYLTSTDSRILKNNVTVLNDDKVFFPVYNPAVNMTSKIYNANKAKYDKLFDPISKLLTNKTILELNGQVELGGLPADKVVQKFLKDHKII